MEAKLAFVNCLLNFERRVYRIYESWSRNEQFTADLRAFWRDMASDEMEHITILERSAGRLNFATMPPPSGRQLAKIEETISAAEHASENLELTADEALGHALALERSELNEFDDAWLRGFKPDLGNLTQAWVPAHEQHVQRLADAICKFTVKENLHKEAAALLTTCKKKSLGEQTFDGS